MLSWIKDKVKGVKGVKGEEDCVFCKIRDNPADEKLNKEKTFLYEDEEFYAIHDISKGTAREHILVITKKHIRSALSVEDPEFFKKMRKIAINVLYKLKRQNYPIEYDEDKTEETRENKFRLGFHVPPYNSIDHIHLHGFFLPFSQWKYDKVLYGWMMTGISQFTKEK